MKDYAHDYTEEQIKDFEKKVKKEYQQAYKEMKRKADDYFYNFDLDDLIMQRKVKYGEITEQQYQRWRVNTMSTGKQWKRLSESLAKELQEVDKIARSMMFDTCIDVYAFNYNYATYAIEKGLKINTSFTLYSKDTVERLMKDNPRLLKLPHKDSKTAKLIREGKLKRWTKKQVQSVATQSILQGESVQNIAKRIAKDLGTKSMNSAVTNARTMITSAENGGRQASYERVTKMGIVIYKKWLATLDGRTRHSHEEMNEESVPVNEIFPNGLMFPADPSGEPEEVYNCRCTMIADFDGAKVPDDIEDDDLITNMSFEEWTNSRGYGF